MADVRLTATNPEDSSVVPVACNAKGELKLEEIPDQSFDGNLDGDLTVTGSATFASGDIKLNATGVISNYKSDSSGYLSTNFVIAQRPDNSACFRANDSEGNAKAQIFGTGSAMFSGDIDVKKGNGILRDGRLDVANETGAYVFVGASTSNPSLPTSAIYVDGTAKFAGAKAGFTAEGHLWCTTRRGDTVILDFTSNGTGVWANYDPPSRREEIKDAWSEKNVLRPKPEDSSQDGPETTQ